MKYVSGAVLAASCALARSRSAVRITALTANGSTSYAFSNGPIGGHSDHLALTLWRPDSPAEIELYDEHAGDQLGEWISLLKGRPMVRPCWRSGGERCVLQAAVRAAISVDVFLRRDAEHVGDPTDTEEAARVEWVPLGRAGELAAGGRLLGAATLVAVLAYLAR
jgi:hypothetical protein